MRRTGVIVGVTGEITRDRASYIVAELNARFPGVTFAVVDRAASSVAFEFDDQTPPQSSERAPEVEFATRADRQGNAG